MSFITTSFKPAVTDGSGSRIEFIDLAKGVCILLVVLFHFNDSMFALPNFGALRMPLYFVISGLFFKSYDSGRIFFGKKINNILVPFGFWLSLSFILALAVSVVFTKEDYPLSWFLSFLRGTEISFNTPLWFLMCLFVTSAIFYFLHRYLKGMRLLLGVLAVALLGNILRFSDMEIPLYADSACTALPFFYFGYILKRTPLLYPSSGSGTMGKIFTLLAALACIGVSYLFYYFLDHPGFQLMSNDCRSHPLWAYSSSLLMVVGVLLICKLIVWLPLVSFFGRYSIIVLCTHNIIITGIYKLKAHIASLADIDLLYLLPAVLLLCWILIPFCIRWLPHFTAQRPLLRHKSLRNA